MTYLHELSRTHTGSRASLWAAQEELADLPVDVTTSRTIAMAIGVLVERYEIAPEEGLDLILAVSRQEYRGMRDVAVELATGGEPEAHRPAPALDVSAG